MPNRLCGRNAPVGVLVPFTMGYRPLFSGPGVVAAYLAALPKGPDNYHPTRHPEAAIARLDARIEQQPRHTRQPPRR